MPPLKGPHGWTLDQDPGEVRARTEGAAALQARGGGRRVPGPDGGAGHRRACSALFPTPCGGAAVDSLSEVQVSVNDLHALQRRHQEVAGPHTPFSIQPTLYPLPAPVGGPGPRRAGTLGGGTRCGVWVGPRPPGERGTLVEGGLGATSKLMSLCRRHLSGGACDTLMFLGKGVWPRGSGTSGLMGPLLGLLV